MKQQTVGAAACIVTAFIWGVSFIAQDAAAETVGPYTIQLIRSLLAAAVLIPLAWLSHRRRVRTGGCAPTRSLRETLPAGLLCGTILAAASIFQQLGISNDTDPGKSAFITALYIVFVPILGLLLGKRAPWHVYLCLLAALGGLWLLCMGSSGLAVGDIQVIVCSFLFAVHILVVDRVAAQTDGILLSAIQFVTCAVISGVLALLLEEPTVAGIRAALLPLLFTGLLSSGLGYTLQILGQRATPPMVASLLFSLESVFAVLADMLLLHTRPTPRELVGMAVILAAILLAQLRPGKRAHGEGAEGSSSG